MRTPTKINKGIISKMTVHHHFTVNDTEYTWPVDPQAAASVAAWAARTPALLDTDLTGMAQYFPHWLLVGGQEGKALRCPDCALFYVPTDGGLRCIHCRHKSRKQADGLLWVGHIPTLARPEAAFIPRQDALRAAGFPEITVKQATYLLVPLTVAYPAEWPNVEPVVRYAARWLDALGLPHNSGLHHLYHNRQACIFNWGEWTAMPIHAVLQQRMVNHIISLLKIAAGQTPQQAFIGRIHNQPWTPEA
jgi:hypothetical protein